MINFVRKTYRRPYSLEIIGELSDLKKIADNLKFSEEIDVGTSVCFGLTDIESSDDESAMLDKLIVPIWAKFPKNAIKVIAEDISKITKNVEINFTTDQFLFKCTIEDKVSIKECYREDKYIKKTAIPAYEKAKRKEILDSFT